MLKNKTKQKQLEELGDYDPERHLPGYVSDMNLVLNQSEKLENQVEEFHSGRVGALVGISASQAVNAFLKKAATLDTYGVDPHPVKVHFHHMCPLHIFSFKQMYIIRLNERRTREELVCTLGRITAALPHFTTGVGPTISAGSTFQSSITKAKCLSFTSSSWKSVISEFFPI